MPAVGGSIEQIAIRGRIFAVASDAAAQRKLGGFENELRANGDATVRIIKTRVPWDLSGLVVEVDDSRGDQEFLQGIADNNEFVDVAMTLASGVTYQATGTIHGELVYDTQAATATISVGGPGTMTSQ